MAVYRFPLVADGSICMPFLLCTFPLFLFTHPSTIIVSIRSSVPITISCFEHSHVFPPGLIVEEVGRTSRRAFRLTQWLPQVNKRALQDCWFLLSPIPQDNVRGLFDIVNDLGSMLCS